MVELGPGLPGQQGWQQVARSASARDTYYVTPRPRMATTGQQGREAGAAEGKGLGRREGGRGGGGSGGGAGRQTQVKSLTAGWRQQQYAALPDTCDSRIRFQLFHHIFRNVSFLSSCSQSSDIVTTQLSPRWARYANLQRGARLVRYFERERFKMGSLMLFIVCVVVSFGETNQQGVITLINCVQSRKK